MSLERKDNDWEESELVQEENTDKVYIHARAIAIVWTPCAYVTLAAPCAR